MITKIVLRLHCFQCCMFCRLDYSDLVALQLAIKETMRLSHHFGDNEKTQIYFSFSCMQRE